VNVAVPELARRLSWAELTEVVGAKVALGPSAELSEKLTGLDALFTLESVVRAGQSVFLADAHDVEATTLECGRTTKSWLVEEMCLNPGEAARRMRLAKGLPDAPVLFAALAAGDIHAEHALVILKVLPHVADDELRAVVEKTLVELASDHPPFYVERCVDAVLAMLGVETSAAAAYERRYGQRGVGIDETIGGSGSLNGTLTPEVREKLRLALEAAGAPAGPEDDRSQRQRFHDALGEIAQFFLTHADTLSPVAGERPRLVVTMSYEMLCDRLAELETQWATLGAGLPIGPETARRLACDADLLPAVLNAKSDVLDLGRSSSVFNLAIRRAAWLQQQGCCAYPKCRRRPADCHHIIWWSRGGRTSLDNAAWLCAYHHWLVHEGGWTMRRDPDGGFTFTSPDGRQHSTGPPRHPQAA
jgi:hypothetical protein